MNEIMKIGLTADVGNFISNMGKAGIATDALGAAFSGVGSIIKKATAEIHTSLVKIAAGSAGIIASLAGATMAASSFEGGLRNVQSITKDTWATTSGLGSELLSFSRNSTASAGDMVNSLYDVASSGFAGADALKIVKASATAAAAGMSDAKTAGFALSGAINAYGMSADDVTQVSDTMFQTVNLGVLTFQDLADGMGQWISMAATAKIPLNDAAAALAAITRAGVAAPEASTGLARIIQSFINPTEKMIELTKSLGFESSELMLHQLGLKGSIETVGKASHGSAGQVNDYFGDIRAGVAAFALLSGAGANYNAVTEGFNDKTALAGATARAFEIQSRGLGAQLTMLKNNLHANVIEIGQYLLPLTRGATVGINKFVSAFQNIPGPIKGAIAAGAGFTAILMGIIAGVGLWYLKTQLIKRALGTTNLAFAGLSRALLGLSAITNSNKVLALSDAFAKASTKGGKVKGTISLINQGLNALGISSTAALVGFTLFTAAIIAGIGAYTLWNAAVKNADKHSKQFVDSLMKLEDLSTPRGVNRALDDVQRKLSMARAESDHFGNSWGRAGMRTVQNLTWMSNDVEEAEARVRTLNSEQAKLVTTSLRWQNAAGNVNAEIIGLNRATGDSGKKIKLTNDEVVALAKSLDVDLGKGGQAGADGIVKVAQAAIDASDAGVAMGNNYGEAAEKVVAMSEEAGKAATAFADDVKSAYQSSFDIVSKFSGSVIEDFNKFKLESPRDPKTGKILTDANKKPLAKQKIFTEGVFKVSEVENFYKAAFQQNTIFSKDLNEAIRLGLDPKLIAKFMAAGPTEAGKLLHTMVEQNQGPLRALANQYEATLQRMATQTAEVGRITALAMQSPTDALAKDLPKALAVTQHKMKLEADGVEATFQSVAKSAGIPIEVVKKIGAEFGITMTTAVKSFKDIPIAQQLTDTLAAQMVDVKTPTTAIDQMIKNYMGGARSVKALTKGVTDEMEAAFLAEHPGENIKEGLRIDMAMGQGLFKHGDTPMEMLNTLMEIQGLNPKVTLEIIASYNQAKELEHMLKEDTTPTKTMNMLLKYVTDPSQGAAATTGLILAASKGEISKGTLEYALKVMGTPEANATLHEFRQEQQNPTDNKITFHINGEDIDVDLTEMGKKFNTMINKNFNPDQKKTVTIHLTTEIVHDGREKHNITQVNPVFAELKKQAKEDPVNIKVLADGSIQVTKDKLEAVTTELAKAKANKGPLRIELVAGEGTEALKSDLKQISTDLESATGQIWTVRIQTDTSGFNLPDKGTVTQGGNKPIPKYRDGAAFGMIYMEEGGVVEKKRPSQAHVAHKPTVMYGEDGTGGEAYIPLAKDRRKRAEGLVTQVAEKFGMKVTKMAVGGIIGDERFQQQHVANLTFSMAGSASFAAAVAEATKGIEDAKERSEAARQALEEMAKTYRDVQMAAGTAAANELAASGLIGDAWANAAQRIITEAEEARHRWDNIWTDLWKSGKVSSSTYFTYMKSQMAKLKPYSDEWLQLREVINDTARSERRVKFQEGDMSGGAYVNVLKKQLAATRIYSDEWKSIKDEIASVEQETASFTINAEDHAYAQHKIDTTQYLALLQKRLAGTKKWSSEYMAILGQIEDIGQSFKDPITNAANAISHFGSTAPQGFGEISNYFTHAIEAAKRYNEDLAKLREMGLDKTLLMQLMQAGPSAVPFMDAIIRGGQEAVNQTNANQATLNTLAGQTQGMVLGTGGQQIMGAASQVTTNNNQVTLTTGPITIGAGNNVTATQIKAEIGAAFSTLTSELQKRNN